MKTATRTTELEPIDRLEEKVRQLVAMIDRLRTEQTRTAEENLRLSRELEALRARTTEAEGSAAEMATLRQERELIRSRVAEMLEQIEALNL